MASTSAGSGGVGGRTPLPALIHGRARLLLLSHLMSFPGGRTFTELKQAVGLTDGTLSVHLGKLEAGGLVEIRKEFVGRKPRTLVRMTADGRRRFEAYVEDLRRVVPGLGDDDPS
ncbi:MAG: transcriptional regulator [Candidatus Krumholzibacteriia bacterium]